MNTETLRIEALAYGGDGVAHVADGRAAFVPGVFPGDEVRVSYVDDGKRYVRAHAVELVDACPQRVKPACAMASDAACGGCPWACLDADVQRAWKRRFVVDALVRIAKFEQQRAEELVGECVASSRQWNYRNKVEFEVGQDVAGRLTLGMHAHGAAFVPLASCKLCASPLEQAPRALTGALRYALGGSDVRIERVGVRHSSRTNSTELAIWTAPGRFPRATAAKVIGQCMPVKGMGVTRVLVKGEPKRRKVCGSESLAGRGFWSEQLAGLRFAVSAPSFFQVNTDGADVLVELVLRALEPEGDDTVLDLYCGAGTFTLPLAREAHSVHAVEMEGPAVRDARRNLERNGLTAHVIGGDVARELADMPHAGKVVVDPPRSGLSREALEGLVHVGPHRIAYVSCDPTTFARDVAALCGHGYTVRWATPVDMFAQSYHVETVALLERV